MNKQFYCEKHDLYMTGKQAERHVHADVQTIEDKIDEILSEYFTWKGEAIWEINKTSNYQRMKARLLARDRRITLEAAKKVMEIWNVSDSDEVFYGLLFKEFPELEDKKT